MKWIFGVKNDLSVCLSLCLKPKERSSLIIAIVLSLTYIIDLVKRNSPARCKTEKKLTAGDKKKTKTWKYFTLTLKPRYCLLS